MYDLAGERQDGVGSYLGRAGDRTGNKNVGAKERSGVRDSVTVSGEARRV